MSLNIHLIRSEVGYEGGAVYTVTFEDVVNPGDVPLLIAHSEGLTGVGATVVTREMRKGSEAIGTAVRVGFSAPQHCSTSQGNCGDSVSYYVVEWDTSDKFDSAALSRVVLDDDDQLLAVQ
ncbi:unnamed protein product, partial [Sphacelaria rigidula]